MTSRIDQKLRDLGIELPLASTPGANYVPFHFVGNLLFLTGQLSQWNGERRFIGKLGREFTVEQGQQAGAPVRTQPDRSRKSGTGWRFGSSGSLRSSRRLRQFHANVFRSVTGGEWCLRFC
jgi:hypothetical protein